MKNTTSADDRVTGRRDNVDIQVDIKPVVEDSQEQRYSNRVPGAGQESPIQYDVPQTETERILLKSENEKLLNAIYDLKNNLAFKDEEIDDLQEMLRKTNVKFAECETARAELKAAIDELAESSGKGEDREKRAWDQLAKVAGWNDAKNKDVKERLAKAIYKKKGFF